MVTMVEGLADVLPAYIRTTPDSRRMQEKNRAFCGTLRRDSLPKAFGASPSWARP